MTNNFERLIEFMINMGIPENHSDAGDLFFSINLLRRGKDHPNLPAANYTFKTYYVDSIEKFQKIKIEIITCCNLFGLRAYISVNVKSKETYTKMCAEKFIHNILNNEYKKPWAVNNHVFGKCSPVNDKVWIIDLDEVLYGSHLIWEVMEEIRKCKSKHKNPIIGTIPTKSGVHILTYPFHIVEFMNNWKITFGTQVPDIHKNHITLLYENLSSEAEQDTISKTFLRGQNPYNCKRKE